LSVDNSRQLVTSESRSTFVPHCAGCCGGCAERDVSNERHC